MNKVKAILHNKVLVNLLKNNYDYKMIVMDQFVYRDKYYEHIKEAKEKGVCPCEICNQVDNTDRCGAVNCFAWYVWFSEHWQNIKEAARRKGFNV
jgi:ribonuclease HIII